MNEGRIAQSGSPDELYNRPKNEFVAGFLGESNFIDGLVVEGRGELTGFAIGDRTVHSTVSPDVEAGGSGRLVIRPEKLWIGENRSNGTDLNSLPCKVVESIFVGDHLRLVAELRTGERVVIKQQERHGVLHPENDSEITICWHREDGRVLPADGG